jgi:predicted SAM-dependent methyltransferase
MDKNLKLHLGSGNRYLNGYVHVDLSDYEHIDIKTSVSDLKAIDDNAVKEIYASHVLEYFDREEALVVLGEWKRVLKKGGILRIAVPNMQTLFDIYKKTNDIQNILGPIFGKWKINNSEHIYHKTIYDKKSLSLLLQSAGFKDIKLWDWREVFADQPEYDDHSQAYFPHMDKENGIHVSLNLECKK